MNLFPRFAVAFSVGAISILIAADDPVATSAPPIHPGQILTFSAPNPFTVCPAFTDPGACSSFVATAAKSPMASLQRNFGAFAGLRVGDCLRVDSVLPVESSRCGAATLVGTLLDGKRAGQTVWTPASCFRAPGDPTRDAASAIPALGFWRNDGHKPAVGEELYAHSPSASKVFACRDLSAHWRKLKFGRARDKKGISDLLRSGQILLLSPITRVLVVQIYASDLVSHGEPVAECRILEGEHRDRLLWVALHELAEYRIATVDPNQDYDALADRAFRAAMKAEKSGRKAPALKRYREIARQYDGTDGAARAAERARALASNPPPSAKAAAEKAAAEAYKAARVLEDTNLEAAIAAYIDVMDRYPGSEVVGLVKARVRLLRRGPVP